MPKLRKIFFLGIAPFLVADDHHRLAIETRQAADDRVVVGKGTIAMQFLEIGKDQAR